MSMWPAPPGDLQWIENACAAEVNLCTEQGCRLACVFEVEGGFGLQYGGRAHDQIFPTQQEAMQFAVDKSS